MSINNDILNADFFSTSKISGDTDLYGIAEHTGKLFKFKKNVWNTNGLWTSGQIEIKTISNGNYAFTSTVQLHTGQIIGVGRNTNLYLVDTDFIGMIELKYNNKSICCFRCVTQLNDYRILLVGTDGFPYCIDSIKNPSWYKISNPGLDNLQKLKQQGFSCVLANYRDDRTNAFKFLSNSTTNLLGSSLIGVDSNSKVVSALPFYDAWTTKIVSVGDNQKLHRTYFDSGIKTDGSFGGSYVDTMWFDNERLKPSNLIKYNIDIPISDGLIGYYNYDSFVNGYWFDLTTSNNNVVYLSNNIQKSSIDLNYIFGNSKSFVIFPTEILPPEYTVFHICKYDGDTKGRILQGLKNNWLSGFGGEKAGIAYHDEWITNQSISFGTQWVLSTDQNSSYRANMHDLTVGDTTGKTSAQLAINIGGNPSEKSDWACACIVAFNRKLSIKEIETMELWLISKYQNLFSINMKSLGFSNFYSIDPNDQAKKTIGKILDDNLETSLYNVKQVKFICPSFDGSKCLSQSDTDFINMQEYGNQIPILPNIKQIECKVSYSNDKPNLADSFKFLNEEGSIDGGVCKNIFDIYNLYPTTNNLAIVNPSINSAITNTIEDPDQLTKLASQYSRTFTDINTVDSIKSSINEVLENTPLKLACCKRTPTDNTQKLAKIFTSISPDVNSANETLGNLNWQNAQFIVPDNTCPTNLFKSSNDCNVFFASYCANTYDYLHSKGLTDKQKLLQIPECACYFPNTKEQEFYPAGTPAVCYKDGCNSGEAYIDPSSLQPDGTIKQCDLTVCQNIINTSGLSAGGSATIDPTLENNCGQYVDTIGSTSPTTPTVPTSSTSNGTTSTNDISSTTDTTTTDSSSSTTVMIVLIICFLLLLCSSSLYFFRKK